LESECISFLGVRLDSGDLTQSSKKVREILDSHNLGNAKIFASGDLDEYKISELLDSDAPIDAFGVGTKMGTSADRPYLDGIYKLSETQLPNGSFSPIMKLSKDKNTLPGRKQVFRFLNADGSFEKDVIALFDEPMQGTALLIKVMEKGQLTYKLPALKEIQQAATNNLSKLPKRFKVLSEAPLYPVELSQELQKLTDKLKMQLTQR
jgi:nicotinate phosphoribosyltransferase